MKLGQVNPKRQGSQARRACVNMRGSLVAFSKFNYTYLKA